MADADKDDTMLSIAISAFNQKCYSVNQISNLSVLFKSDLSKCNFFESAYSHVIDKNQFESLQKLLSDDKAIGRFKQIMKNQ